MAAQPRKMGLSLYADLLGSDKQQQPGTTISGAPVKYDTKRDEAEAQKKKDASLQFQPIRRPQATTNRPTQKKGAGGGKGHVFSSSTSTTTTSLPTAVSSPDKTVGSTPVQQPNVQRSNFEDWVGDEDEDVYYDNRPKERGGRKKKKKKAGQQEATRAWDWNDIYDPTMPNNYADYKDSEEQRKDNDEWKEKLYYHRNKRAKLRSTGMAGMGGRGEMDVDEERPAMNRTFAPPGSIFAPPSFDDAPGTSGSYEPPVSFSVPDDATGEDAYLRRMRLSGMAPPPPAQPTADPRRQPAATIAPPAKPAVDDSKAAADIAAKKAEAAAKIAAFKAKVAAHKAATTGNGAAASPPVQAPVVPAPPPQSAMMEGVATETLPPPPPPSEPQHSSEAEAGTTIARAPVRYSLPAADANLPSENTDTEMSSAADNSAAEPEVKSKRPGQQGFAERLLQKYGWEKGKGLGVEGNEGITTAPKMQAEKRKKKSDAQGGGFAAPAPMGKIVGGKRRKVAPAAESADGGAGDGGDGLPYGPISDVIKLEGMLGGLDVDDEIMNKDLYGEIGREMEEQYGKVERVFLWRQEAGGQDDVFVKFVNQVSALRAVGACDGMEFAGNTVKARFFDGERFEKGEYA